MINRKYAEKLIKSGKSDEKVAEKVGCHIHSIKSMRLAMGISHSRNIDYEMVDVLIEVGVQDEEIATMMECSIVTIALRRRKKGIKKLHREYASGVEGVSYYPDIVNMIMTGLREEYKIKGDFNEWAKTHKKEVLAFQC